LKAITFMFTSADKFDLVYGGKYRQFGKNDRPAQENRTPNMILICFRTHSSLKTKTINNKSRKALSQNAN
ncbi:MAG: hypothetical protein KAI99_23295, partial [Cyclobacteriaceae bacterium]|nr:hypothetical protein [Cyclobacteriaceae bacterium]